MVVFARTLSVMERTGLDFQQAFWVARAGTVFTTHTPVGAGFDRYAMQQVPLPDHFVGDYLHRYGLHPEAILALGRQRPDAMDEPFNMTWLALRGSAHANAVSARHRVVSQQLFQALYPRWPVHEVPIGHVTNGVHMPSWDSEWADALWTSACGKKRWRGDQVPVLSPDCMGDETLWGFRAHQRSDMIEKIRHRLEHHNNMRPTREQEKPQPRLDPNALTIGFARRFTAYKRATLLLHDPDRLTRLLTSADHPVQVIVAGKAHPADIKGKADVAAWVALSRRPELRLSVVFLEDYDLAVAQDLVAGVDLWLNTPEPPLEACGTSGMKVLVNGGLNLSMLDGWWAEAYEADVGWAIASPDGYHDLSGEVRDASDAAELYRLLEDEIVPEFYDRDTRGVPVRWVARIRKSLERLTPRFHTSRMAREYLETFYGKASSAYAQRLAKGGRLARELDAWAHHLMSHWHQIHFGDVKAEEQDAEWFFSVRIYLGEIEPDQIAVQLYADASDLEGFGTPFVTNMTACDATPGAENTCVLTGCAPAARPAGDYSIRIVPAHPQAFLPAELPLIRWQK
jgi:starch phosphorylase